MPRFHYLISPLIMLLFSVNVAHIVRADVTVSPLSALIFKGSGWIRPVLKSYGAIIKEITKEELGSTNFSLSINDYDVLFLVFDDEPNTPDELVEAVTENSTEIHDFVRSGGCVVVFKDWWHRQGSVWTHRFSPSAIYIDSLNDTGEWDSAKWIRVIDDAHPIFKGFKNQYPQLRVSVSFANYDLSFWSPIAVEKNTGRPAYLEARYGEGIFLLFGIAPYGYLEYPDVAMFMDNLFDYVKNRRRR